MKSFFAAAALAAATFTPSHAVDRTLQNHLAEQLKPSVPSDWWLRASWRDKNLVVFVSPPPPESFRLWYATEEQREMMEKLCRAVSAEIWSELTPDEDIAIEQVVGGNGGKRKLAALVPARNRGAATLNPARWQHQGSS